MLRAQSVLVAWSVGLNALLAGCSGPRADWSAIQRPPRPAELDAYDAFVGSWKWTAKVSGSQDPADTWAGTAQWTWSLDKRCLQGSMTSRSVRGEFDSLGLWSWNPRSKKYEWSMFNSWGYPQNGVGTYDPAGKSWTLSYRSIGLDGTTSHGRYDLKVVNPDTIDWTMTEWADRTHLIEKFAMSGTYTREKK